MNLCEAMARQYISNGLKAFIREQVQTVFRLEVLLPLHREQSRSFTAADVALEILSLHIRLCVCQARLVSDSLNWTWLEGRQRLGRWRWKMSENIERAVRSRYGSIALSDLSSEQDGVRQVATNDTGER
jgi:hypothetical protein